MQLEALLCNFAQWLRIMVLEHGWETNNAFLCFIQKMYFFDKDV